MINKSPIRKNIRLRNYDYSQNGYYFITICSKDMRNLFGQIVGVDSISARMINDTFIEAINKYKNVKCPIFITMPNHFHCIIYINRADMESAPTIAEIIQTFKRHTTIKYIELVKQKILPPFDKQIWQRGYYDHIIRNENDYKEIYEYIENNPQKWELDKYYIYI